MKAAQRAVADWAAARVLDRPGRFLPAEDAEADLETWLTEHRPLVARPTRGRVNLATRWGRLETHLGRRGWWDRTLAPVSANDRLPNQLLAGLVDPDLTGAACVGLAPMFDAELADETTTDRRARVALAAKVCARCPVFAGCETAAQTGRPSGVWAGQLHLITTTTTRKAVA